MKILIVDDSKATLEIVRRALEDFGYRRLSIQKTNSAKKALELIESWQPDILLTDWYMPEMTGLNLIASTKSAHPHIKSAMITTVEDREQIEQALTAGASFVLSKPFEDSELHRALLPLVQGLEEDELVLEAESDVQAELALPKLSQLAKLLSKEVGVPILVNNIQTQQFDETKVPCLLAVYEDSENQRLKAVAMLDVYAVCVLAQGGRKVADTDLQQAVHNKMVSKPIIDQCRQVLDKTSIAFLDSNSRKSLRLKSVNFVAKPFEKLETLYRKSAESRLDFSCQSGQMAQGKITVVGF